MSAFRSSGSLSQRTARAVALLLAVAAVAVLAAVPASAAGVASRVCPPRSGQGSVDAPPPGYAVVVESRVNEDCSLTTEQPRLVRRSDLEATLTPANTRAAVDSGPARSSSAASSGAAAYYSVQATVYQRLWDCCGVLLNEFDTTTYWQYNVSQVTYYSAHNAASYHRAVVGGWNLDNDAVWVSSIAPGWSQVTIMADADFHYQGSFDLSGVLFHNHYVNTLTVQRNGAWRCSWSYIWRAGFPGWHTQNWCG